MERERWTRACADEDGHYSGNTNGQGTQFCNENSLLHGDKVASATCIQHSVSRFDTLPGIAIKYGVEVADIKKMNGLFTDLQMFGFKTLQIPLPGRHPPLPCFSNESTTSGPGTGNQTPTKHFRPDWLESFQSLRLMGPRKVSPVMSSLRGYYGLRATENGMMSEVFEMAVYRKREADCVDDGLFLEPSNPHLRFKRKSGFYDQKGEILVDIMSAGEDKDGEPHKSNKNPMQKSKADFTSRLSKEENNSDTSGGFRGRFSRTSTIVGYEMDGLEERKSSSISCFHDHWKNSSRNGSSSSLTSRWSMASRCRQPEVQAVSTAGSRRLIFDGFTKPMSARKNKDAID